MSKPKQTTPAKNKPVDTAPTAATTSQDETAPQASAAEAKLPDAFVGEASPSTQSVGMDLGASERTETVFNVQRLAVAHSLPVLAADVETQVPHTAAGSITVFKSPSGENMEIVLVAPALLVGQVFPAGTTFLTNHAGHVLAAQPFKQLEAA